MVKIIDHKQIAKEKWRESQKQMPILNEIEKQGVISNRLRRYCNQLIVLNGLSNEVEAYALENNLEAVNESLLEMKKFLMGIQCNYFADMIKKPELGIFYKELYDFAYKKYEDTIKGLHEIIEGVAI